MKITTREIQLLRTIKYLDDCIKTIYIQNIYEGNAKKPVFMIKTIEYKNSDGTIDEKKSNTYRGNMGEINKPEIEYIYIETEMLTTINYNNNSTRTIKYWKGIFKGNIGKYSYEYKKVEFRYPNGKIDENRSYDSKPFDKSERKETSEILFKYGYNWYARNYRKLLKKYNEYNKYYGIQLLPEVEKGY